MAEVTRTIHVRVSAYDPAQRALVPVPGATVLIEDSGWLWDPDLSDGTDVTDAQGRAAVDITFDDAEENALNPFVTITVPGGSRTVPASAPPDRQMTLPGEWVTRHYVNRRIPRITAHTNPNTPLQLLVGVEAQLSLAYSDFASPAIRNPMALPADTLAVHLLDKDVFLNPDDPLKGFAFDDREGRTRLVGEDERYPYGDVWPVAPCALDGPPAEPRAWLDPPYAPIGTLGGGTFAQVGPLASDRYGFLFMVDGDVIRRFYPDGTLCQTITGPGGGFSSPGGLALDQYRHLFVADSGNDRVLVFRLDGDDGGDGLYKHYAPGAPSGATFSDPRGLTVVPHPQVDGLELLAVAETGNQRVQVFTIDFAGTSNLSLRGRGLPLPVQLRSHSTFGTSGSASGQFQQPTAIAADPARRLFVADAANHRVSRWALNPAASAYIHQVDWERSGGGAGSGAGEFDTPRAIAVDGSRGYVYVADTGNRRVQRLDAATGAHFVDWRHTYTPALGSPFTPSAIAVDARGEVYAADEANDRIVRATTFDASGAALADGAAPRLVGQPWTPQAVGERMQAPRYVAFAPDGRLWVADTGNDRALVFERAGDGSLTLATQTPGAAGLSAPAGIAVDGAGNAFVVDGGNHRVVPFDPSLTAQGALGGGPGSGANQFDDPRGIALADRGEPVLYVADRRNDRVQRVTRAGSFGTPITTADGLALDKPEDVAVDGLGNLFIADTGNARIVQFDPSDAFVRTIQITGPTTQTLREPSGVAVDAENKLIVTDHDQNLVFRLEPDGRLLAYWNLGNLLRKSVRSGTNYYVELARLIGFDAPSRAAIDGRGLLAVADTGLHRVRLVQTSTRLALNLTDLGEALPDIAFRARATADWTGEIGLKHEVTDVGWLFDDTNEFTTEPEDDFARDRFATDQLLDTRGDMNAAANVMKTVRLAQRWLAHLSREDEAAHRWGRADAGLEFQVDISDEPGSNHPWGADHVNLRRDTTGRGFDAWDDSIVVHEMGHWIFDKSVRPYPPFRKVGGSHSFPQITSQNLAITEGFAEYIEMFWGGEYGSIDRVRGRPIGGTGTILSWIASDPRSAATRVWLTGGLLTSAPTFATPQAGLEVEGYFCHAVWQIHHALAEPGIRFADAPNFWYGHNTSVTPDQSARFASVIRRALRSFPDDPTSEQLDQGSRQFCLQTLERAHALGGDWPEIVRSLLELNNLLMPEITITDGGSSSSPGTAVSGSITERVGQTRTLTVQVEDATGAALRGYGLKFTVANSADYSLPGGAGPARRHGLTPPSPVPSTEMYRATNASGLVSLTFTAPPLPSGSTGVSQPFTVSYQPDFDTDASFAAPTKGDDRETTLRKLYLNELRSAAKAWSGVGNNLGAAVSASLTINIEP